MGLCKCPKRKVTNLFCFEHRVNVCESCLLANHESCVVQTYLSWLTDSDYDANCLLCFEPLNSKETVRLKCMHLFHWDCFDARARQLPDTTAPAGYKCPSCLECIFPPENQQSPVVDKLKVKLQTVNWGRLGLGLPSMPEHELKKASQAAANANAVDHHHPLPLENNHHVHTNHQQKSMQMHHIPSHEDPFEVNTFTARSKLLADSNGSASLSSSVYIGNEDESKYTKKATEQSLRTRFTRLPRSLKRLLLALLVLALLYAVFSFFLIGNAGVGQQQPMAAGDDRGEDPLFDPHANPNVRVQRQAAEAADPAVERRLFDS